MNNKALVRYAIGVLLSLALTIGLSTGCAEEQQSNNLAGSANSEEQLYSCGMHPNVLEHGPGGCPICGMDLTPVNGAASNPLAVSRAASGERKIKYWVAPMDPTFISDEPGKSPMGMDLVAV